MPTVQGVGEELFWEEVRRAQRQDPVEKLLSGMRLFESACRVTLAGIRHQHPGISDVEALAILKKRVAIRRSWDEVR
jgi:hypothetical protein